MRLTKNFGGFATYSEYLDSPHWKRLRSHFCGPMNRCYGCDTPSRLQIHHTCYDHLGKEQINDFIVVCRDCHERIHEALRIRFPGKILKFQVERTDHVFPGLFGRTLQQARQKYRHQNRWGDFMLGGRQPVRKAKSRSQPVQDPAPPRVKTKKKPKKQKPGWGKGRNKGNWMKVREAKRSQALQVRETRETEQRVAEDLERRSKLGPEYAILKLPTLEQRIRTRIALREQVTT